MLRVHPWMALGLCLLLVLLLVLLLTGCEFIKAPSVPTLPPLK